MLAYVVLELNVPDETDHGSITRVAQEAMEESPTFARFNIQARVSSVRIPQPRRGWWERG